MGFSKRITVTVTSDSSKVPSNQSAYPLYIDITDPVLKTVSEGGYVTDEFFAYDVVAFSDPELTQMLPFEAEVDSGLGYTGSAGRWRGHIKIDIEPGGVFYLGVGNSAITTQQGNPEDVWPSGYKLVSHLHNQAGIGQGADSTANNKHGVAIGTTRANDGSSKLYLGLDFDGGSSTFITYPDLGISGNGARTVSMWIKPSAFNPSTLFSWGNTANLGEFFTIHHSIVSPGDVYVATGANDHYTAGSMLDTSEFVKVDVVFDGGGDVDDTNLHILINDVEQSLTHAGTGSTTNTVDDNYYAGHDDSDNSRNVEAILDEIRVADIAVPADRRTIAYHSENDPGTFVSFDVSDVSGVTVNPVFTRPVRSNLTWR